MPATISGSVMGFNKDGYTRPIKPAFVFLLPVFKIQNKKVAFISFDLDANKSQKFLAALYDCLKARKIEVKEKSDLNSVAPNLSSFIDTNAPWYQDVSADNLLAEFIFKDLVYNQTFSYLVAAIVEGECHCHIDKNGNNGAGGMELISMQQILAANNNIAGVIVPVKDTWLPKPIRLKDSTQPAPKEKKPAYLKSLRMDEE